MERTGDVMEENEDRKMKRKARDSFARRGREEKTNRSPLKLHRFCFTSEGRQSHQSRKWSERESEEQKGGMDGWRDGWMDGRHHKTLPKDRRYQSKRERERE